MTILGVGPAITTDCGQDNNGGRQRRGWEAKLRGVHDDGVQYGRLWNTFGRFDVLTVIDRIS